MAESDDLNHNVRRVAGLSQNKKDIWFACSVCFRAFKSIDEISEHKQAMHSSGTSKLTQPNLVNHADTCFIVGDQEMIVNVLADRQGRHLLVRKSPIHGRGLFTGAFIFDNEIIMEYVGEVLTRNNSILRRRQYDEFFIVPYVLDLKNGKFLDATIKGNCSKFVNYSCSPNIDYEISGTKVYFYSLREIFPGEELVIPHLDWSDEEIKANCQCGYRFCHNIATRLSSN